MFVSSTIARVALLALAVLLLWALFAGESGAGGPERSYRVKPGDTLWSIAERTFPAIRARASGSFGSGTSSTAPRSCPARCSSCRRDRAGVTAAT